MNKVLKGQCTGNWKKGKIGVDKGREIENSEWNN